MSISPIASSVESPAASIGLSHGLAASSSRVEDGSPPPPHTPHGFHHYHHPGGVLDSPYQAGYPYHNDRGSSPYFPSIYQPHYHHTTGSASPYNLATSATVPPPGDYSPGGSEASALEYYNSYHSHHHHPHLPSHQYPGSVGSGVGFAFENPASSEAVNATSTLTNGSAGGLLAASGAAAASSSATAASSLTPSSSSNSHHHAHTSKKSASSRASAASTATSLHSGPQGVGSNKKERRRTQSINNAFSSLRDCIPNVPCDTKLSKIKTLRLATLYIDYLMQVLNSENIIGSNAINGFKADIHKKWKEKSEDQKRRELEEELNNNGSTYRRMTKPCKGGARTGWPQHVWALELKQ